MPEILVAQIILLIEGIRSPLVDLRVASMQRQMSFLALEVSNIVTQKFVDTHEILLTDAKECHCRHMGQTVAECRHGVNVE